MPGQQVMTALMKSSMLRDALGTDNEPDSTGENAHDTHW